LFYGCGTGPWYIKKSIYNIYKEPIYQNSKYKIRTDGYYVHFSDKISADYTKPVIIFNNKGYVYLIGLENLQNLIKTQSPFYAELDWWCIKNDSIIIENYGETKRLMTTLVWWHKGVILNDSILNIGYEDYYYKRAPIHYKFVKDDFIPELLNSARYFGKEWYNSNLNPQRK